VSDQFVAEIRIFGFNFPPTGWAFCNGQLLPISQNTALFSLLGTTYGGDGKSTFALPNMQGNAPMHAGQGQGLSLRDLGEIGGEESVTLLESEMPAHTHSLMSFPLVAAASLAAPTQTLGRSGGGSAYKMTAFGTTAQLAPQAIAPSGSSLPHNNMMPYLTLNFCIALQGIFPSRP
jgi:microcystin-dependent protein